MIVLKIFRKKEDYKRTLNLTFLQITMPKKDSQNDENNAPNPSQPTPRKFLPWHI